MNMDCRVKMIHYKPLGILMNVLTSRIQIALFVIIAAMIFLPVERAQATMGDGPRAYQLLPEGMKTLTVYGISTEGNQTANPGQIIKGADLDVNLGVLQYTHTFSIKGQQSAAFGILPFGEVNGSVNLPRNTLSASSSGIGDAQLGCVFGVIGSPALPAESFAVFKPGFAMGLLGKLGMPTGEYDEEKVLNLGANRWSVQLGLPAAYSIGKSSLDPSLTRFEILPSVTFYTDNDDPYHADECEQEPLFNLEAHITRNLHQAVWVSLDALYTYGGETTTDGIADDNSQRAFSLGGTVNFSFSKSGCIKFSYGETIERNDSGADGSMVRAVLSYVF
jgi:hypothetical protein